MRATVAAGQRLVLDGAHRTLRAGRRAYEGALTNNLLVVLVLLIATFMLAVGRALLGGDSWLTFMVGREIVDHGLPHHESLTTIPLGRTWTDQQWLAQLLFYRLERLGGLGLAVLFHALMVTTALAIAVVASRVRGASARMTLVGAIVCLLVAPWSWQLRAQSIALPLFALTLALTATDRRLAAPRTWLVFPILVLWANVHGSVVLGAILVSFAALLALVGALGRDSGQRAARLWRSAVFLLAPWACILISPYGTDLVAYYRLLLVDSPVSKYITEWQAPHPDGYTLVFFVVAVATVVIVVWQRRRLSLYDLGVLALTLAGASRSVRAVVWFSLALAILLPVALDGFVRPSARPPVHRRLALGLVAALTCIVAATAAFVVTRSEAWYEHGWPTAAARATAHAASTSDTRAAVWPSDAYADWLLWKEPSLRGRLAWDVRFELLTEPELRSIVRFKARKQGWQASTTSYPILVLDPRETPKQVQALRRQPGTTVVFSSKSVVVLLQR